MSESKTETFIFNGLGFPIKLIDVPMKKLLGEWVADIDWTELQLFVLRMLAYKPARLTRHELKFIRHFLVMTATDFGKIFGVTHSSVVQWESGKRKASPSIELLIRFHILDHLHAKDKEFRNLYNKVRVEKLSKSSTEHPPFEIDASEEKFKAAI